MRRSRPPLLSTTSKSEKSFLISATSPKAETLNSTGDIGIGVGDVDSVGVASTAGVSETSGAGVVDSETVGALLVEVSVFPPKALSKAMRIKKEMMRRTAFLPFVSPGLPVATYQKSFTFEEELGVEELITLCVLTSVEIFVARRLFVQAFPSQYRSVSTRSVSGYHPAGRVFLFSSDI